ncbi:tetratricopeptide repeat protein [Desulfovibrio sp. OttesenSCG-928-C06]|nr:tetratricopeptide repeat protein [Desulfovibrio sp. OttesenSCG-928-C06]
MFISHTAAGRQLAFRLSGSGRRAAILFLLLLSCLLWGCQPHTTATKPEIQPVYYDTVELDGTDGLGDKGRVIYLYLVLNSALGKGDAETAMTSIQELLYLAPTEELFREAVSIYEFSERHQQALETAATGAKLYPLDLTLHMMQAELMARSGQVDESIARLKEFSDYYNKNQKDLSSKQKQRDLGELRLLLIRLFMSDERYAEAEAAIAALPARERTATVLYYEAQILKSTGRTADAMARLQALVEKHPNFTEGWMALAAESEQARKYQAAAGYYKKALETNDMPQIFMLMIRSLLEAKQYRHAVSQVVNSAFPPEVKLQTVGLFVDKQRYAEAREILLILEEYPYLAEEINFMLAMIAYDSNKDIPEAVERLQDIPMESQSRSQVLHLKALLLIRISDYKAAAEAAESLRDEFPEVKDNWLLLSEVNNMAELYPEAEIVVREALEQWPGDVGLLYSLGTSLGFQKKSSEALSVMEEILESEPDNALALNYAGYTLADENKELDRAMEMITRAMELEPDSLHIVDSLAWVHYRLGNYEEAWSAILRCVRMGGNDPVIWDHYGDIAFAAGRLNEAIKGFKNALEMNIEDSAKVRTKLDAAKALNAAGVK